MKDPFMVWEGWGGNLPTQPMIVGYLNKKMDLYTIKISES